MAIVDPAAPRVDPGAVPYLGVLGTAAFASTASAHERDAGRIERRGGFDRDEGYRSERFDRRERFEPVRRGPFLRHRELRERGW